LLRIGIGALALALLAGCGSDDSDDAPERASNRDSYVLSPDRRAEVEREQAAKTGRAEPDDRAALLRTVERSILKDARARVRTKELKGPVRRVTCERTRKAANAFSCTAVTNELKAADSDRDNPEVTGVTGHPYRAVVDFATGDYAWCKRILVPGEGGVIDPRAIVPLPKECQA
jgi:hypothetical protein